MYGNRGDAIICDAKRSGADLIIVKHDRNALDRSLVVGSCSAKVVQNAHCDVPVVR
jgi:nucleotide-binding universal stress UspA family protein